MKTYLFILFFFIEAYSSIVLSIEKKYSSQTSNKEIQQKIEAKNRSADILNLRLTKMHIIRGDLKAAAHYLEKIRGQTSKVSIVKERYLALIYFIEDRQVKVSELLSRPKFNTISAKINTCLLHIISKLHSRPEKNFKKYIKECKILTSKFSKNSQMWLEHIENLQFNETQKKLINFRYALEDNELLSIWIKMALYFGEEQKIINTLKDFPKESYESKRIRELVGLAYYRQGNFSEALNFIEDIDTPNSENIKGNINLSKKEFELAFGHFQLALKKKGNSINALERSLPLAWILGQWDKGEELLEKIVSKSYDDKSKLALESAFLIRKENFDKASNTLKIISAKFNNRTPRKVDLMKAYTFLRRNETRELRHVLEKLCKRYDGMSCWLLLQLPMWQDIGETLNRDEPIHLKSSITLESLKTPWKSAPITEIPIIDQKDIEELDNEKVKMFE